MAEIADRLSDTGRTLREDGEVNPMVLRELKLVFEVSVDSGLVARFVAMCTRLEIVDFEIVDDDIDRPNGSGVQYWECVFEALTSSPSLYRVKLYFVMDLHYYRVSWSNHTEVPDGLEKLLSSGTFSDNIKA